MQGDVLRANAERHRPSGLGRGAKRVAIERQAAFARRESRSVVRLLERALDKIHSR
jgi:hypothetical protein